MKNCNYWKYLLFCSCYKFGEFLLIGSSNDFCFESVNIVNIV